MSGDRPPTDAPHLMWVYTESPAVALDAGTWLETTRELRKLGWRVTLIGAGPAGKHLIRGVEVLCIPMMPIYFFRQALFHLKVIYLLAREWHSLDAVLFHQMSAPWLLPLRIVRNLTGRKRPVLVMDSRTIPMRVATPKDMLRALFYRVMKRLAKHWVDGQTAITWSMAKSVGIPSHQLWGTWPSGVNLDTFARARTDRRWPMPGEPIHLIYIGVLNHERNLRTFCQAVEQVNSNGKVFVLTLIGEGSERPELERLALHSDGRVRIMQPVPHHQVSDLLAKAHIGVLPFPDEEKFRISSPIKLFEYMAAGLPVLATKIVSHTGVVKNRKFAFWAEDSSITGLHSALLTIRNARSTLNIMGSEAALAAESWTWKASAKRLSDALRQGMIGS